MKSILLTGFVLFLLFSPSAAEELLRPCTEALNDSSYRPLREYLSKAGASGNLCHRLNKLDFLYTDERNIYYCKSGSRSVLSCEEHEESVLYPGLSAAARFSGKKGKEYVLLKTSMLLHGVFRSGYHAFFLVPKNVNGRGYVIFPFADSGEQNGLYSGSGRPCDNLADSHAVTAASIPFQILDEGSSNPAVRFNQEITSCKTGKKTVQTLEYRWRNGTFTKTLDKKEPISVGSNRSGPAQRKKGK